MISISGNFVIARSESDELIAFDMGQVQAFQQEDEGVLEVVLPGHTAYVKGEFIDMVNSFRKILGVEPATIEQIKAALDGGAE